MKKLLSFTLAICLCLCVGVLFTSCDDGVNEDEWKAMLAAPNFTNYTLSQVGTMTYTMNGASGTNRQDALLKFTADKVQRTLKVDDQTVIDNEIITGDVAAEQKQSYEQVFLAVLADYNNFEYDSDEKVYKNPNKVSVDLNVDNYVIKVEMENGKVTLSEDGKLMKFVCTLTQTTEVPEQGTQVATGEITWVFSDYGTTAVAE